jgi:DNA helicase HerA-like ATPase
VADQSTETSPKPKPAEAGRQTEASRLPDDFLQPISDASRFEEPEEYVGSVGRTMFDSAGAQDGSLTVLLPADDIASVPVQSLVRIRSLGDHRDYLGIVTSGPFAEPDGLRADSNVVITTAVRGGIFMPRYHGRVQVEILGEEIEDAIVPPRFRPLPNSPVFVLGPEDKARILRPGGDIRLGVVVGDEEVIVGVPSDRKSVLPRHTAVLGTTGGGKSTTIGGFVSQAQSEGFAIVLLDTEGEYVQMHEPATDAGMLAALRKRGSEAKGLDDVALCHLVGMETANPGHPERREFGLTFSELSPYAVAEILDMTDAQQERFLRTVDIGKQILRDLRIFPKTSSDDRRALELNEFEEGYPELTLSRVLDIAGAMLTVADHGDWDDHDFYNSEFNDPKAKRQIHQRVTAAKPSHPISWRATLARLWRLHKLRIFDQRNARPLDLDDLLRPGRVAIVDLSGTDSPQINNIAIADLLRRIQRFQDEGYKRWEHGDGDLRKVLIIIEEAHEFLAAQRISKMPILFQQVSRIAKRGRKRWLGLVFVTQLPQHLPREVLGLVNNHILHKINDEGVIRSLRQTVPGIDEGLWRRLPALAPGQAIVSASHMARALLVSIDPSPCQLRMID